MRVHRRRESLRKENKIPVRQRDSEQSWAVLGRLWVVPTVAEHVAANNHVHAHNARLLLLLESPIPWVGATYCTQVIATAAARVVQHQDECLRVTFVHESSCWCPLR